MNTSSTPSLDQLAEQVRLKKDKVAQYKYGHARGHVSYDDLAAAGKELSAALYNYSRAKFPNVKPRRLPYQAIIR